MPELAVLAAVGFKARRALKTQDRRCSPCLFLCVVGQLSFAWQRGLFFIHRDLAKLVSCPNAGYSANAATQNTPDRKAIDVKQQHGEIRSNSATDAREEIIRTFAHRLIVTHLPLFKVGDC